MPKKNCNFFKLFLQNSPINQHKTFMKIITVPQSHHIFPPSSISEQVYLAKYLSILGEMPTINHQIHCSPQNLVRMASNPKLFYRSGQQPSSQSAQLLQSIKQFCNYMNKSFIPHQQLAQRLTIARPETIKQLRKNLTYLFKILLNKRDKLAPGSQQLELNIQMSQTIIKAFQRSAECPENAQEWNRLQAIQKLLRARDCHKKGLNQLAMVSFQEIFKDKAAESKTRMQALKIICQQGQQQGDISILQLLMNQSQGNGEKEFQQYIKQSIKKIKQGSNSKSSD